jgi:membrane fusion protein (multidrug efflux system)
MTSDPRIEPNDADADGAPREPAPRRWLPWAVGAGVLAAAAIVWAVWWFSGHESTDDARVDGHVHPVAARVGGTVLEVAVRDNQTVKEGDLLVVLDPKDAEVALARARADLGAAEAAAAAAEKSADVTATGTSSRLDAARSALSAAAARLTATQAREREAAARAEQTEKDRARLEPLLAKDEVSHQEYDAATAAATAAAAARDAAGAAVEEAARGVDSARAELAQASTAPQQTAAERARAEAARARVEQAKAAVEQARLALDYTRVQAPASGRVSSKSVEVGQIVSPGQPLLAVVSLDDVWITADFKESQLEGMRPGQPVSIRVDAVSGRVYRGRIDSIAAATSAEFSLLPAENATGNFVKVVQRVPVKIVLEPGENEDHLLRPGLSVVPTVNLRGEIVPAGSK